MEGVVLYIALVRVFVTHPKQYIMSFTLLSYGLLIIFIDVLIVNIIIRYSWNIYVDYNTYLYLVGTDENHTHYLLYDHEKLVASVIKL